MLHNTLVLSATEPGREKCSAAPVTRHRCLAISDAVHVMIHSGFTFLYGPTLLVVGVRFAFKYLINEEQNYGKYFLFNRMTAYL